MTEPSPDATAVVTDPAPQPGRWRAGRRTIATTGLLLVACAGIVVWNHPTGNDAEEPGPVLDLASRVHVHDAAATKINGTFDGLTVILHPQTIGDQVIRVVTGDPAVIVPDTDVRPPDVPSATYHSIEKAAFVDGGQVAAAVAERALGKQVTVTTAGLAVEAVDPGSPAAGAGVHVGDRIVAVDGSPVDSSADLTGAIQHAAGGAVALGVKDAAGTARTVRVMPTAASGSDGRFVVGVVVDPADVTVHLAVPVTVDASGVEGPSAGLMTALTVYDQLSPTDVARGRTIAGTGTLDIDGNVGPIGGIEAKARAAAAPARSCSSPRPARPPTPVPCSAARSRSSASAPSKRRWPPSTRHPPPDRRASGTAPPSRPRRATLGRSRPFSRTLHVCGQIPAAYVNSSQANGPAHRIARTGGGRQDGRVDATVYAIAVDAVVVTVASVAAAVVSSRVPAGALAHDGPITRQRRWERGGRTYERFGIRRWKSHLPDAGALFAGRAKRHLPGLGAAALAAFAVETRRAELVHWASAAVVVAFPLWNPAPLAAVAAVLWVAGNLPCIAAQRYNRARIQRLLASPAVRASRRAAPGPGSAAPGRSASP